MSDLLLTKRRRPGVNARNSPGDVLLRTSRRPAFGLLHSRAMQFAIRQMNGWRFVDDGPPVDAEMRTSRFARRSGSSVLKQRSQASPRQLTAWCGSGQDVGSSFSHPPA